MVAEFTGNKISAFRNYFDDATPMEQMLATWPSLVLSREGSNRLVVEDSPDRADLALLEDTSLLPRSRQPTSALSTNSGSSSATTTVASSPASPASSGWVLRAARR